MLLVHSFSKDTSFTPATMYHCENVIWTYWDSNVYIVKREVTIKNWSLNTMGNPWITNLNEGSNLPRSFRNMQTSGLRHLDNSVIKSFFIWTLLLSVSNVYTCFYLFSSGGGGGGGGDIFMEKSPGFEIGKLCNYAYGWNTYTNLECYWDTGGFRIWTVIAWTLIWLCDGWTIFTLSFQTTCKIFSFMITM